VTVAPLNRTLEQEVFALLRGASLECLVCGEFVLHRRGEICCPECGMSVARAESGTGSGLQFGSQAG
jgi:Zn finger protein HypA/HybF involved in hydrogenase expression